MMMIFLKKSAFAPKTLNPLFLNSQSSSLLFRCFSNSSLNKQIATTASAAVSHVLLHKHHFSPQSAEKVLSALKSIRSTTPQNADYVLSFFKEMGFTPTQLERMVTGCPEVLSSSLENTIKPKLQIFQDLGLSSPEIAAIFSKDPYILKAGASRINVSFSIYKGLLGSDDRLAKILKTHGRLLYANLEETLLPNIEFLKSCGVTMDQITRLLYLYPHFLVIKPEGMRNSVRKVDEMGVERTSKMFMYVLRTVCNMSSETLELKLKAFKDLGLPEDDIKRFFRRSPTVFTQSVQSIKKKTEFLLETGKYDMSCIANCPNSLNFSVEKRYKPRVQVLKSLEKRNLIKKWPSLPMLGNLSDKSFFQKFVEPYVAEVGEPKMAKNGSS